MIRKSKMKGGNKTSWKSVHLETNSEASRRGYRITPEGVKVYGYGTKTNSSVHETWTKLKKIIKKKSRKLSSAYKKQENEIGSKSGVISKQPNGSPQTHVSDLIARKNPSSLSEQIKPILNLPQPQPRSATQIRTEQQERPLQTPIDVQTFSSEPDSTVQGTTHRTFDGKIGNDRILTTILPVLAEPSTVGKKDIDTPGQETSVRGDRDNSDYLRHQTSEVNKHYSDLPAPLERSTMLGTGEGKKVEAVLDTQPSDLNNANDIDDENTNGTDGGNEDEIMDYILKYGDLYDLNAKPNETELVPLSSLISNASRYSLITTLENETDEPGNNGSEVSDLFNNLGIDMKALKDMIRKSKTKGGNKTSWKSVHLETNSEASRRGYRITPEGVKVYGYGTKTNSSVHETWTKLKNIIKKKSKKLSSAYKKQENDIGSKSGVISQQPNGSPQTHVSDFIARKISSSLSEQIKPILNLPQPQPRSATQIRAEQQERPLQTPIDVQTFSSEPDSTVLLKTQPNDLNNANDTGDENTNGTDGVTEDEIMDYISKYGDLYDLNAKQNETEIVPLSSLISNASRYSLITGLETDEPGNNGSEVSDLFNNLGLDMKALKDMIRKSKMKGGNKTSWKSVHLETNSEASRRGYRITPEGVKVYGYGTKSNSSVHETWTKLKNIIKKKYKKVPYANRKSFNDEPHKLISDMPGIEAPYLRSVKDNYDVLRSGNAKTDYKQRSYNEGDYPTRFTKSDAGNSRGVGSFITAPEKGHSDKILDVDHRVLDAPTIQAFPSIAEHNNPVESALNEQSKTNLLLLNNKTKGQSEGTFNGPRTNAVDSPKASTISSHINTHKEFKTHDNAVPVSHINTGINSGKNITGIIDTTPSSGGQRNAELGKSILNRFSKDKDDFTIKRLEPKPIQLKENTPSAASTTMNHAVPVRNVSLPFHNSEAKKNYSQVGLIKDGTAGSRNGNGLPLGNSNIQDHINSPEQDQRDKHYNPYRMTSYNPYPLSQNKNSNYKLAQEVERNGDTNLGREHMNADRLNIQYPDQQGQRKSLPEDAMGLTKPRLELVYGTKDTSQYRNQDSVIKEKITPKIILPGNEKPNFENFHHQPEIQSTVTLASVQKEIYPEKNQESDTNQRGTSVQEESFNPEHKGDSNVRFNNPDLRVSVGHEGFVNRNIPTGTTETHHDKVNPNYERDFQSDRYPKDENFSDNKFDAKTNSNFDRSESNLRPKYVNGNKINNGDTDYNRHGNPQQEYPHLSVTPPGTDNTGRINKYDNPIPDTVADKNDFQNILTVPPAKPNREAPKDHVSIETQLFVPKHLGPENISNGDAKSKNDSSLRGPSDRERPFPLTFPKHSQSQLETVAQRPQMNLNFNNVNNFSVGKVGEPSQQQTKEAYRYPIEILPNNNNMKRFDPIRNDGNPSNPYKYPPERTKKFSDGNVNKIQSMGNLFSVSNPNPVATIPAPPTHRSVVQPISVTSMNYEPYPKDNKPTDGPIATQNSQPRTESTGGSLAMKSSGPQPLRQNLFPSTAGSQVDSSEIEAPFSATELARTRRVKREDRARRNHRNWKNASQRRHEKSKHAKRKGHKSKHKSRYERNHKLL